VTNNNADTIVYGIVNTNSCYCSCQLLFFLFIFYLQVYVNTYVKIVLCLTLGSSLVKKNYCCFSNASALDLTKVN